MTASTPVNAAAHALLNDPAELAEITRTLAPRDDGARRLETVLTVDGVHCAACVVSIEAALRDAVESVSVNAATRRARLVFLPDSQPLSSLFERIERLGYRPRPVSREAIGMAEHAGRRVALWRMLVASLCMMQIMMYAVPRYTAAALEMPPDIVRLLTWAEWTLSLPVLIFAAGPFFRNAWHDLRQRRIGMDVPVALGIAVTFISSSASIARGDGCFHGCLRAGDPGLFGIRSARHPFFRDEFRDRSQHGLFGGVFRLLGSDHAVRAADLDPCATGTAIRQ